MLKTKKYGYNQVRIDQEESQRIEIQEELQTDDYQKYLDGENSSVEYKPKNLTILSRVFFLYLNKIIDLGRYKRYELGMLFKIPETLKHENKFPEFKKYYKNEFQKNPKKSLLRIILEFQFWLWIDGSFKYFLPSFCQLFLPLAVKYYLGWLTGLDGGNDGKNQLSDVVGVVSGVALIFISLMKSLGECPAVEPSQTNCIIIEMLIRVDCLTTLLHTYFIISLLKNLSLF